MLFFGDIWEKFALNLVYIQHQNLKKKYVERAPSKGDIWDEFSEQHYSTNA